MRGKLTSDLLFSQAENGFSFNESFHVCFHQDKLGRKRLIRVTHKPFNPSLLQSLVFNVQNVISKIILTL